MTISFSLKTFDELTTVDLYYILQARSQVFVVEQNCVYQDIDELDFDCLHLVAHNNQSLVGYCRIIPPETHSYNLNHTGPRIGRVLVLEEYRGNGYAHQMMQRAIKHCQSLYRKKPIALSAQHYLINFYQSLGFNAVNEPYYEDGIEHIEMVLTPPKLNGLSMNKVDNVGSKNIIINLFLLFIAIGVIGTLYILI